MGCALPSSYDCDREIRCQKMDLDRALGQRNKGLE